MQILDDLYNEINRLFIAGSRFAKGDPRLAKHVPPLEKMGERAPILKKLAEKVSALVDTGSPETLTGAGTFLYAVMATQGVCAADGETLSAEPSVLELPETNASYLRLKPVLEALTASRQGRLEVIENAFAEGTLKDFRLFGHIAAGLDDKYSELADYLHETVIPSIGAPMVPYLLEKYDPKGKRGDAMRLALLGTLGYEEAESLAFSAINEGDILVATEGIKLLGMNPQNEEYLLKLAGDKKAAVREAALLGLVSMNSARGKALVLETLSGAKYKCAVPAAGACDDGEYTPRFLALVRTQYDKLKKVDVSEYPAENDKLNELIHSLAGKNDSAVYDFYMEALNDEGYDWPVRQKKLDAYRISDVRRLIRDFLEKSPPDEALRVYERTVKAGTNVPGIEAHYLRAACGRYDPERLFDVFAPFYRDARIQFAFIAGIKTFDVTPKWKKLFIMSNDMDAVSALLREDEELAPGMKRAVLERVKNFDPKTPSSREQGPLGASLGRAIGRYVEITPKKSGLLFKSELDSLAGACFGLFEKLNGHYIADYVYDGIGRENFLKLFHPDYAENFKKLAARVSRSTYRTMAQVLESAESSHG